MKKYTILNKESVTQVELSEEQLELHYVKVADNTIAGELYQLKEKEVLRYLHVITDTEQLYTIEKAVKLLSNVKNDVVLKRFGNSFTYSYDNKEFTVTYGNMKTYEYFIHGREFDGIIYESIEGISDEYNKAVRSTLRRL